RPNRRRRGNLGEVQLLVGGLLAPVALDALAEVALWVEEADADEGDAQIAGLFAVVAGKNAQAARVDRQRLMQPELGAKVRDGVVDVLRVRAAEPRLLRAHVGAKRIHDVLIFGEE